MWHYETNVHQFISVECFSLIEGIHTRHLGLAPSTEHEAKALLAWQKFL